jgi:hypothetical protein
MLLAAQATTRNPSPTGGCRGKTALRKGRWLNTQDLGQRTNLIRRVQ